MNAGDTAWVLVSTALVMVMLPGLAFFYGGLVSSRNVLVMLQQNIFPLGLGLPCAGRLCESTSFSGPFDLRKPGWPAGWQTGTPGSPRPARPESG